MKYQKIGDDIYIPKLSDSPLKKKKNVKFNYYLSSRIHKNLIDLDITTKLFAEENIYVRKSSYKVRMGEIESCVKANLLDHMQALGMDESNIPASLNSMILNSQSVRSIKKKAYY